MFSDILDLPSLPRKWASRMLRAMHAADTPLTANRRRDCYVEDTAPGEMSSGSNVHPW